MADTVEVPLSLLHKMAEASEVFHALEEEFEDFLLSRDKELLSRLEAARTHHHAGNTRPFAEIRRSD